MVRKIYLLIGIILLTSCDTKLRHLEMSKTPYLGDELRIDGYYYSNSALNGTGYIGVAVFYRDGFCIHTWAKIPVNHDTLNHIENDFLLNDAYLNKIKSAPGHIGVFQVMYPNITMEVWESKSWIFTHYGNIVNDTTFIINERRSNSSGNIIQEGLTYRFVQFSPKPDSTNIYVK